MARISRISASAAVAGVCLVAAGAAVFGASVAHAGPNDIVLHRFLAQSDPGGGETCLGGTVVNCTNGVQRQRPFSATDDEPNPIIAIIPDEAAFEGLVKEMGIALAPRLLEPAETLGQAGFSMAFATTVQDIRNKADYWVRAMPELGDAPPGALTTLALQMRKGLPWSFEIGGAITHLVGSEMYAMGTDLKWTMADGLRIGTIRLPDVALRGSVNRLVGNRDLDLIVGGGDVTSGINKRPVATPVEVGELGLSGDAVCNTQHHGGLDQAVYLYRQEDNEWWSTELGRDVPPGTFGENLTVKGLAEPYLCVGDEIILPELRLQVTAPRIPCNTLAAKMNDKLFAKKFMKARLPGIYCRVLEAGTVREGDTFSVVEYPGNRISTVQFFVDWKRKMTPAEISVYLDAPIDIRSRTELEQQLRAGT